MSIEATASDSPVTAFISLLRPAEGVWPAESAWPMPETGIVYPVDAKKVVAH